MLSSEILDLARLEAFDPHGGRGSGANRRFCCPLCGDGKPLDTAHRSLIYHADNGAWNCKRCGESGKLRDFWDNTGGAQTSNWRDTRGRARKQRAQLSQLRDDAVTPLGNAETGTNWREQLRGLKPLDGTPGADYLIGRGIPVDVASLAGVRFARDFYGRPAVVFPIRNRAGDLVAAQGRHTDERTDPKARTCGPKSQGVFFAPVTIYGKICGPFDARSPGVIICEAPIDALSFASCGFPAIALVGINAGHTKGPAWLQLACGLKSVFPAFDADEAGDDAAPAISAQLATYGARCATLRPQNAKDWNEALQAQGANALREFLKPQLFPLARVTPRQSADEVATTRARLSRLETAIGHDASIRAVVRAHRQIESAMNAASLHQWRATPAHDRHAEALCVAMLDNAVTL